MADFSEIFRFCVGVDTHIDPVRKSDDTEIPGEFVTFQWGDVLNRPLRARLGNRAEAD